MKQIGRDHPRRGRTLIELLVVALTIAILTAVLVPGYLSHRDNARDAAVKRGARVVQVAVQTWAVDHGGQYPDAALVACDGEVAQYIDSWPGNPWTGRPMSASATYSKGDFCYEAWNSVGTAAVGGTLPSGHDQYALVGWTSDEATPFVVQPFTDSSSSPSASPTHQRRGSK